MLSVPMADKRARKVLGKLRWHTTEMMRPRPCYFICAGEQMSGDLAGLRPVSGFWIRPLLNIGRNEIESYLEKVGISYCTDETNAENVYARNKLRNQVIPQLEEINEQAVCAHFQNSSERA